MDAVLFDLDGTLVDSFPAIAASGNYVRGLNGLPPLSEAEVRRYVGNGLHRLLERICPAGDAEFNAASYLAHHPSVLESGTVLLDGVLFGLQSLRAAGIKQGVCSNKPLPLTERLLEIVNVADLFDVVLGPESVPRRKPAPDMLLEACRALNVGIADALYVGDMTVDIEAARAAGMTVWVLPTGVHDAATLNAAGPDRLYASFSELAAAVLQSRSSGMSR